MDEGLYNPTVDAETAARITALEDKTTAGLARMEDIAAKDRFLPGTFTVDTLPAASANAFKYASVTDLGGGADTVLSDGTYWKHIRRGVFSTVAPAAAINVVPLKSPTIFVVSGTINMSMNFVVNTTGLYPGYLVTVKRANPLSTVLGLVGSLGIKTDTTGAPTLSLTDQSSDLMWDGTKFVQI